MLTLLLILGGSSSAVSDALGAAPPSPVVGSCRDDRLLSAAALGLSKHEVAATLATASPDGAPAAVADRDGVAVLAPADFCAVGRVQQSRAAHDAAGARPGRRSAFAGIELAPAPPSAGNQGSDPIGRGRPTTDGAAGLATGDEEVSRRAGGSAPLLAESRAREAVCGIFDMPTQRSSAHVPDRACSPGSSVSLSPTP